MALTEEHRLQTLQLLQAEIACASKMVLALDQEYTVLTRRDSAAISALAQHKQEIIAQLESLGRTREALTATSGSSPATLGIAAGADPYHGDAQLFQLWNELKTVALQCRQKNLINGRIAEVGFQQSRQALDILHGVSTGSGLYDKSGRASPSARSATRYQV
jgi:flagellar biosynthesis/type III secretory pathway chaperone